MKLVYFTHIWGEIAICDVPLGSSNFCPSTDGRPPNDKPHWMEPAKGATGRPTWGHGVPLLEEMKDDPDTAMAAARRALALLPTATNEGVLGVIRNAEAFEGLRPVGFFYVPSMQAWKTMYGREEEDGPWSGSVTPKGWPEELKDWKMDIKKGEEAMTSTDPRHPNRFDYNGFLTLKISDYGVPSTLPRPGWSGHNTANHVIQLTRRVYSEFGNDIGNPRENPVVAHIMPQGLEWRLEIRADGSAELFHGVLVEQNQVVENEAFRWRSEDGQPVSFVPPTHDLAYKVEPKL